MYAVLSPPYCIIKVMQEHKPSKEPYKPLGRELKVMRERAKESIGEVSGAVEIDARQLASYELGKNRPTEEVLLLLFSHFDIKDSEAVRLWELADYKVATWIAARASNGLGPVYDFKFDDLMPSSTLPILFTDIVDIMVNNYGVVMNFMQSNGANAPNCVARVGMSREHAKSVLQILQVTLGQTEQKQIVPKIPESKRRIITSDSPATDEKSQK